MKFMAATIVKYILDESRKNRDRTLRFVLPSYPPDLLFEIGKGVADGSLKITDITVRFEYGIAYKLGETWQRGTQKERDIFHQIKKRNWYNDTDNLTSLRHLFRGEDEDCLIVLLAGYQDIRDQASLQDFFHLDQKTLWEICLNKSFELWVIKAVKEYVNPEGNEDAIKRVASIFRDLYQFGFADPLEVSRYLETKDFSIALDGRDVLKAVLADLNVFGLPNMIGYEKHSKKRFTHYLTSAQKFMSYSSFIDENNRRKARNRINAFKESKETPSQETLGVFKEIKSLLASLEKYIDKASQDELDKLAKADFVYLYDKILQFKVSRRRNREQIVKLKGHALEVFLHALWLSLTEFKKNYRGTFVLDNITSISLQCQEFKHQYDNDNEEKAQDFLNKLLGGIDEYLEAHVELKKSDGRLIDVEASLFPKNIGDINYIPARTAVPGLFFQVYIRGENSYYSKKFEWLLGKNCQARFLVQLFNWVCSNFKKSYVLPIFNTQYVNEMFMVKDEEDLIRIMNIALERPSSSIEDLFDAPNVDQKDPLQDSLYKLSTCYQEFLSEYTQTGFISALYNKFDSVRKAYSEVLSKYVSNSSATSIGPFLMKAFMLISEKYSQAKGWQWNKCLKYAVVTPLHPALLDMIHNQHAYLCKSFCTYILKGLAEVGVRGLAESNWHRLVDLAQIKWPIQGLIDDNSMLDTNVRSYDYIHLVGTSEDEYSTISSRLLVKYEDSDSHDVSDTELFRLTQEGKLIQHVLFDYRHLHPYANDGLSIGVYCGGSIQQVIVGIDAFLAEVANKAEDVFSLNLTIFSDSPDDTGISTWVEAWKERWHEAEGVSARKHYAHSKISVYYRVVPQRDREHLTKLIYQTDLDLVLFINFTRPKESEFKPLNTVCPCGFQDYLKFPVLEKVNCAVIDGGKVKERELVLSNRRFNLGTLHAEVMARLRNPYGAGPEHVVVSTTDFGPWEKVIDAAHKNCVWFVCMDPIVDEKLIRKGDNDREIIGFGTGVGPHGEYNFTISTEQFYLSDVVNKISRQLAGLIKSNDHAVIKKVASNLTKEALSISGLSIVKATGPSQYVRDFIAYALVRKLLPQEEEVFCDEIISLDAFMHWFDFGPGAMRPDLLRLQAKIENLSFKIKAQIIECKLAKQSEGYLEKALQQIEEGLKQLIPKFRPRQTVTPVGVEDEDSESLPPDQRYWWMQLHRLISSRGEIRNAQYKETLQALEGVSDGCYDIEWEAAAMAFWTDVSYGQLSKVPQWNFNIDDQEMNIYSIQCGKEFIVQAGLNQANHILFDGSSTVNYYYARPKTATVEDKAIDIGGELPVTPVDPGQHEVDRGEQPPAKVSSVPKRIFLGRGTAGGRDIYWEFGHPDLPNRHLLIFGASGTGKTYTMQAVMAELSKCKINSLIVDYTSGFTKQQLEPIIVDQLNPKQHIIRRQPLAVNPFRKQSDYLDDEPLEDKPAQVAQRASGVFAEVYRLGEQQKSVLYNAIQNGVEDVGNSFNLNMLVEKLEDIRVQGGVRANPAVTVLNKIKPFVDMNPFGQEDPESWEKLFLDPISKCHVIQLAGFMKNSARLITEFSLIDLYWYYRTKGGKDKPRVIVLDEIQNLDHSLERPLGQFLTEGRKFGISLILATQTLSNLSKDERDRLFQASHKLFFKPADTEIKSFAQLLASATNESLDSWIQRLSGLKRGECYSMGYAYNPGTDKLEVNRAFKIKINSLEDRF